MGEINKFHAMQLFTDTFIAETVHLTNNELGIYTRLLNFHWTKNAKPFRTEDAYVICQCKSVECEREVMKILTEFFIMGEEKDFNTWTNKRVVKEYEYLTNKYKVRAEAGKKGGIAKWTNANSKNLAPTPIPKPIPKNIYDEHFEELWSKLRIKRGSKFKAFQEYWKLDKHTGCTIGDLFTADELSKIYNNQQDGIEDKFVPHFSTWLSQKRWETEQTEVMPDLIDRMKKLGYLHKGREDNFEKFTKDGNNYKIDIYDTKNQLILEQ